MLCVVTFSVFLPSLTSSSVVCASAGRGTQARENRQHDTFFTSASWNRLARPAEAVGEGGTA